MSTTTQKISGTVDTTRTAARTAHEIAAAHGWKAVTYGIHWPTMTLHAVEGRQGYKALTSVGVGYAEQDCVPHDWDEHNQCRACRGTLI